MATANLDSSPTDNMTFSVLSPIQSMSPNSDKDSIRMNKAAKNNNVDHSTLANTDSISSLSASIKSRIAPRRAVHPKDRRCSSGTEWRKKNPITKINAMLDFINNGLLLIGY